MKNVCARVNIHIQFIHSVHEYLIYIYIYINLCMYCMNILYIYTLCPKKMEAHFQTSLFKKLLKLDDFCKHLFIYLIIKYLWFKFDEDKF